MRLIILAAGTGSRLGEAAHGLPKCFVSVGGRPLIEWQLEAARAVGVDDVVVVYGEHLEQFQAYDVRLIHSPDFLRVNMVRTLFRAREFFGDGFVVSYGDIAYRPSILRALLACTAPAAVVVDVDWRSYWEERFPDPLVDAESLKLDEKLRILSIGQPVSRLDDIEGQYIGLSALRGTGVSALEQAYDDAARRPWGSNHRLSGRDLDGLYMTDLLQELVDRGVDVRAVPIRSGWLEIDTPRDLELANRYVAGGRLTE